jgi:hypothetical protein
LLLNKQQSRYWDESVNNRLSRFQPALRLLISKGERFSAGSRNESDVALREGFSKVRRRGRRPETGVKLFGESISQGRREFQSYEVVDEARNPKREDDLFGEASRFSHFKASRVRNCGLARKAEAEGVGLATDEVARAGLEGDQNLPTRIALYNSV